MSGGAFDPPSSTEQSDPEAVFPNVPASLRPYETETHSQYGLTAFQGRSFPPGPGHISTASCRRYQPKMIKWLFVKTTSAKDTLEGKF